MPPAVRTRRASTVVPLPSAGGPGTGTPSVDVVVPLSPMDTRWAALPPVCHVFLFPTAATAHHQVPFSDVVRGLSSSLAAVLPAFHTLAGELAYSPELGTVTIVCGEDAGVAFVEAETDLDFASLAAVDEDDNDGAADLDVDALPQLVPDIRREELPAPMFAAQVTEFVGGIAVGVALNHVATDGIGFFRFMEMWAASAAGATTSGWTWTGPLHDRSFVRFDGDQELARSLLRQAAPVLPRIVPKQQGPTPQRPLPLSRRTFTFSAHALRRLKQRLTAAGAGPGVVGAAAPSTFATLAAHAWVSFAVASSFTDAAPVFAVFLADCRAHMSPRVPDAYAGNCVVSCVVALSGAELTGADGPALAFLAIRDAAAEVKRDPLAGSGSWITRFRAAPPGRKVVLAGSPWFPAYAVDFGFGWPARVERASLGQDGEMAIFAGREAGSVQASVAVSAEKMPAFHRMFAVKSGSNKARL